MLRSTSLATGRIICCCVHSFSWSLATFYASSGKQRKWVNCEVHRKSLANNRIPRTIPCKLPPHKLALYPYPVNRPMRLEVHEVGCVWIRGRPAPKPELPQSPNLNVPIQSTIRTVHWCRSRMAMTKTAIDQNGQKQSKTVIPGPLGIPLLKVKILPFNMATNSWKFPSSKQYQNACMFD